MTTGLPRRLPLAAVLVWSLAGCGSAPAPDPAGANAASPSPWPPPAEKPGHVVSCPPIPSPEKDGSRKGIICQEVPKPCSPQPCAGTEAHDALYVTEFERWTAPSGAPEYRLRWKYRRGPGKLIHLGHVDLHGSDGTSILRHSQVRYGKGCGSARRKPFEIPADRTTTYPSPMCLTTRPGQRPTKAIFNFWYEIGGAQSVMEVPLPRAPRRPSGD